MKETIYGEKIILRQLCVEDAEFFARWYNEPEVMFTCGFHKPITLEAEFNRLKRQENNDEDWYAIVEKSTGQIIGETGLLRMWPHWKCTDMSMIIPNPDDRGKGYGYEAGRIMLDRAFNHYRFNRVAVGVVGLNAPALKYWRRLGFREEGIQEQGYFYNGAFSDFVMMRMLKGEYN